MDKLGKEESANSGGDMRLPSNKHSSAEPNHNLKTKYMDPLIYLAVVIGIIYVFKRGLELLEQVVRNQERVVASLENIARKLESDGKP